MKTKIIYTATLTAILSLFSVVCVYAGSNAGVGTASYLRLISTPKTSAMGLAGTGLVNELESIMYNPAAIATLKQNSAEAVHMEYLTLIQHETVIAGYILPWKGVMGLAVNSINFGDIAVTDTDELSGRDIPLDVMVPTVIIGTLSYAQKIFLPSLSAGVAVKYAQEKFSTADETDIANIISVDAGIMFEVNQSLTAGMCYQNIAGSSGKYALPGVLKLGAGYKLLDNALTIAADFDLPSDAAGFFSIGTEFALTPNIALRAGYNTGTAAITGGGITAGIGLTWEKWQLNYAYVPYGGLGLTHRVGLKFTW
ncbi:MAG: PorV/PorQ family protein [Elusimicrobiota bacterium]